MASAAILTPNTPHTHTPADYKPPPLRTNEGQAVEGDSIGWLTPTTLDTPMEEMRRRFDSTGYLFLKGLIPREDVLDMREHYFTHMQASHPEMLQPTTSPRAGIFNSTLEPLSYQGIGGTPDDTNLNALITAHTTPYYRTFLEHPDLRTFVRDFKSWSQDLLLTRTMLRHNVPGGSSTGIHYDKIFLRGGESEFLTAWVPIGDIAANGGGLLYLEDSTKLGMAFEEDFQRRAEEFTVEERISAFNRNIAENGMIGQSAGGFVEEYGKGMRWLTADYEAGDVVFHNPYVIHASGKNEDREGRIRLSTDLRFYEYDDPGLDARWMKFWTPGDHL